MKVINCFGDSLTYGARDEYGLSYPSYLQHLFDKNNFNFKGEKIIVHNSGINGNTSSDLIRRLSKEFSQNQNNFLLIILIGSNDAANKFPIKIYEKNLNSIIELSKQFYKSILISEIPYMKDIGLPIYHNKTNLFIKSYNTVISKLSKKHNIDKIKLDKKLTNFIIDTVHYNSKGYQLIAKNIYDYIRKKYK